MPQTVEFASGFASRDAPLVASETIEKRFQLQIVGRQSGDIIARQQLLAIAVPEQLQSTAQGTLRCLVFGSRLECVEQLLHLSGYLQST